MAAKMYPILIIILFLLLTGCSTTKVHLYTKYLSEEEVQSVTKALDQSGFDVIENTLSIPNGVSESSVIYSPFLINIEQVNSALVSLSKLGWTGIRLENFVKGNHWYGKNNFGLILLPEGLIRIDLKINEELSQRYVGTDCDAQVEIELHSNSSYKILYNDGNNMITKKGSWKVTGYPYLELSDENGLLPMYLQAVKRTEQDLIGKINIIEIKPIQSYHIFSDCKFSHGVRS